MQDDIEKAYNKYMSKKKAVWSQIAEVWGGLYLRVEPHLFDIFTAGYKAHAARSGWCFDMRKAPKKGHFLAYDEKIGFHITTYRLCFPSKGVLSPHVLPLAWMSPPPPPQSKGSE